jgi:23S rRNA (adenine2503-C2)-methyltransferase
MLITSQILISSLFPEEMGDLLNLHPNYRQVQLFQALYQGKTSFDQVTVLPKAVRDRLNSHYSLRSTTLDKILPDGDNAKYIISLADGKKVETVLLTDERQRKTVCVSCQVGCAMGCTFCKTGTLGLIRNLQPGEIVEQILHIVDHVGMIDNIVYMGMGEPMNNLDAVLKSIRLLSHPQGFGMSLRRFTVSTCGLVAGIQRLTQEIPSVGLAFSLVTAESSLRTSLMPTAKANTLDEIKEALLAYQKASKRRVTLEAAFLPGHNDREQDADAIADFTKGLDCIFNLIPWNPVPNLPFTKPKEEEVRRFTHLLEDRGVKVVRRYRRAANVAGACGQLGESVEPKKRG